MIKDNIILILAVLIILFYFNKTSDITNLSTVESNKKENFSDYVANKGLLPDGKYVIRGSRNNRFCTDSPNGIICNRDEPGPNEIFTIQHLDEEKYAIQGHRSGLWCALTTTGMRCESATVRDWSVFKFHPLGDGKYGIQSNRNNKWCADSGTGLVCDVDSMYGGEFQTFEIIPIRFNNIK